MCLGTYLIIAIAFYVKPEDTADKLGVLMAAKNYLTGN